MTRAREPFWKAEREDTEDDGVLRVDDDTGRPVTNAMATAWIQIFFEPLLISANLRHKHHIVGGWYTEVFNLLYSRVDLDTCIDLVGQFENEIQIESWKKTTTCHF